CSKAKISWLGSNFPSRTCSRNGTGIDHGLGSEVRPPDVMSPPTKFQSLGAIRASTLVFPPAGLVLLWRSGKVSFGRKLFGTLGIAFYSLLYLGLVVLLLHFFFGLQPEFRGGLAPRWTFHKTLPDYDALEASRAKQKP